MSTRETDTEALDNQKQLSPSDLAYWPTVILCVKGHNTNMPSGYRFVIHRLGALDGLLEAQIRHHWAVAVEHFQIKDNDTPNSVSRRKPNLFVCICRGTDSDTSSLASKRIR